MAARQRNLRVRGLVKAMNQVRDGLRAGIEPEEESDFRHYVREVIASADRICKTNRITPADLPTPSWKAYEYLRSIDLEHLPRPTGERVIAEGSVRIPGILATCSRYHRTFRHIATSGVSDRERRTETGELARDLRSEAAAIEELCQTAGASPDALPTRSRRGYRWLSFLGDPANLERHVRALSVLEQAGNIKVGTEAQFRLFNTSMLYQTRTHGKRHEVLVNEGFIDAPQPILNALARAALGKPSAGDRSDVKAFSASKTFAAVRDQLQRGARNLAGESKGQHHDLCAAFARVNRRYFDGRLDMPRLVWSRLPATHKMGHYDAGNDTVVINTALDHARVPRYVVDSVVHHELLHKAMGTAIINGRRHMHTPAFREAERVFDRYDDAQRFLRKLASKQE